MKLQRGFSRLGHDDLPFSTTRNPNRSIFSLQLLLPRSLPTSSLDSNPSKGSSASPPAATTWYNGLSFSLPPSLYLSISLSILEVASSVKVLFFRKSRAIQKRKRIRSPSPSEIGLFTKWVSFLFLFLRWVSFFRDFQCRFSVFLWFILLFWRVCVIFSPFLLIPEMGFISRCLSVLLFYAICPDMLKFWCCRCCFLAFLFILWDGFCFWWFLVRILGFSTFLRFGFCRKGVGLISLFVLHPRLIKISPCWDP